MNYNEFKNSVLGKRYDIDGYFGAQCWDGYAQYCKYLGYGYACCTSSGYVKDIWLNRKSNGMLNNFNEVNVMQPGDIVVFKEVAGWTPYSHVAIFDHDAGGGYGWFLGQNQGGASGAFNIVKLPYSATYDTAFRPKKFATEKPEANNPVPTTNWDIDAVLRVGDTVKSRSCAIQGIQGNCVICNELGGLVPLAHVNEAQDTKDGSCDNYLATTAARVYLAECKVQKLDPVRNTAMVHGYWVNCEPLMARR